MKLLLIVCLLTSILEVSANDHTLKLCLTGSTEKTIPNYGEAFWNGAVLAKEELEDHIKKKIELELHYYDVTPLAALNGLKSMRKAGCDAIIGFSTGNDLIAVEEELARDPILTLSIYGDPLERFKSTKHLRTIQPSATALLTHLFNDLPHKIHEKSKVLVITASDRSEMVEYQKSVEPILSKLTKNTTYSSVIEQTQDISEFQKIFNQNQEWDFVILFTRSLIAARIVDKFSANGLNKKPIYLGTKYFGTSELPAFFNFLKNKNVEAYFSRQNCSCDSSKEYLSFQERYEKQFKKKPMLISVDTFDAVKFLSKSAESLKRIGPDSVINFFNGYNSRFRGVGTMAVEPGFQVKAEDKYLIKVTNKGYENIK